MSVTGLTDGRDVWGDVEGNDKEGFEDGDDDGVVDGAQNKERIQKIFLSKRKVHLVGSTTGWGVIYKTSNVISG